MPVVGRALVLDYAELDNTITETEFRGKRTCSSVAPLSPLTYARYHLSYRSQNGAFPSAFVVINLSPGYTALPCSPRPTHRLPPGLPYMTSPAQNYSKTPTHPGTPFIECKLHSTTQLSRAWSGDGLTGGCTHLSILESETKRRRRRRITRTTELLSSWRSL